jgi:quinol monooxygenase YgiN
MADMRNAAWRSCAAHRDGRVPEQKETNMTVKLGLLALLEAKPDKGAELGAFLEAGQALAVAETGTVTWYAFKMGDTEYGIFDSFETEDARQAHLNGDIPTALGQVAPDLLAKDPDIRTVDVIAAK